MDVTVHRTRFIEWTPTAITCLAFPPIPPQLSATKKNWFGTLAVGRSNGNIELYEWSGTGKDRDLAPNGWVLLKVRLFQSV